MTRKKCLDAAAKCVLQGRDVTYGGPEDSFGVIANFWSVYLGRKVYPHDVAMMMALLKIARIKGNHGYADGYIDLAGYAACGAECAREAPAPETKPEELAVPWKRKAKAEDCEEPEKPNDLFRSGTPIEVKWGAHWVPAKYMHGDGLGFHHVQMRDGAWEIVGVKMIRPASKKAEGVEELVVSPFDAPQTPDAVCRHIVDCNPATFHTPSYAEEQLEHHSRLQTRTPTGEELAEMAEENAHG